MAEVGANLSAVRERVSRAAERSGRDAGAVELLVVTKTWPPAVIREVLEAGQTLLGENKLQEAERKMADLPSGLRWHFIGRLQRNKARKALELFESIHSVDSLRLARHLDRIAGEIGRKPSIYIQVNTAGEESKSGFEEGELRETLPELTGLKNLQVVGLMSIPPAVSHPEAARTSFQALRVFRDELEQGSGMRLPGLSMGMSHDFEIAIEEGSTIVRVGSSIFGPRTGAVAQG
ncbi:MAG: YggS family pyridoxal phosphate-dependent enzyme [Verrucomicrobiaceae bacterium]|nr:YggS family pyridoxal phosphate-dependent enzyme [Verrucomicrobiaceae bacterium]